MTDLEQPLLLPESGSRRKNLNKQLTGLKDDGPLHSAAREGNLSAVKGILSAAGDDAGDLAELLSKQNQGGETALFVACQYGDHQMVEEMLKYYDASNSAIKAKNGYDALHIAAKQGNFSIVNLLLRSMPDLVMTADVSNTTALHTAATQGHLDVVKLLLEADSDLAKISRSNGKTALHSACRNGHLDVVRSLLEDDPCLAFRTDKKGQTALHMAAKGQTMEVVKELLRFGPSLINLTDAKGNTALHIATRKDRLQIVEGLLELKWTETRAVNKSGESALDIATKTGNSAIAATLTAHGVRSARAMGGAAAAAASPEQELTQTVSDIKHEVHSQMQQARRTRRRVQGIADSIDQLHAEGLNNAINSITVVAVLIAAVAFAAIFTLPGEYVESPTPGYSLGEAYIAPQPPFIIFFISDSVALFISLAVVLVQTSLVVVENKAKKKLMAVANKLMWLACVLISVAFLALAFIVVGKKESWMAISVSVIGAVIMVATLATMCWWVVAHKVEARRIRRLRRESSSNSRSHESSAVSESDSDLYDEETNMYAI